MLVHSFTLLSLCREISPLLKGSEIVEIYSQNRNELLVSVKAGSAGREIVTVSASVEPNFNYFVLREEFARKRKNSINLFTSLSGSVISNVRMHESDRIIFLELSTGVDLQFHLYNTVQSNILLVRGDVIVEAFKRNKSLAGTRVAPPSTRTPLEMNASHDDLRRKLMTADQKSIHETIKICLPHFGKLYIREVIVRSGVSEERTREEVSDDEYLRIAAAIKSVYADLEHPQPRFYEGVTRESVFSVIPLHQMPAPADESFHSVNDGILEALRARFRKRSVPITKPSLSKAIHRELERTLHSLEKASASQQTDPSQLEQAGNLLLAHLPAINKGASEAEVPNIFESGSPVVIRLDPLLSPAQNAERYFERARKARLGSEESRRRRASLEHEADVLQKLEQDLGSLVSDDEFRTFLSNHKKEIERMLPSSDQMEEESVPFRIFSVTGGYEVWVGKSSASNDLLTMKYAKPHDYWFHVRGASGSHTILRVVDKSKPVAKEAIREAAAIAAYYSKMRRGSNVPVAYCERKFVRKMKGLKEGAVVMEREKIVFVQPSLP
ncbi:MAG TPA: NFACT RNA binding domain-containing protein [Bacteroidota bacterium]|nr:NFACT RNA binding domain-containing protein [Bacteroidota bacterium]